MRCVSSCPLSVVDKIAKFFQPSIVWGELRGKIVKIAVVGLGKIGLPLAAQYASKGNPVIGVDVNEATVDTINMGKVPFPGELGLDDALKICVADGLLRATKAYEDAIPTADVVVIVVPLFVDNEDQPDFTWMDSATRSVAKHLVEGTLVIFETTLPIGTTRNRWKPMLEEISGLSEGSEFHVVFSPERVLTGRVFEDLKKYPKLIGGLSEAGAKAAVQFYEAVLEFNVRDDLLRPNGVWDLGSAEAAEMAKLAETTYRDVNIGLANQFALHAEEVGVDVYKVIEACNSQPYSHIHRPGISVGGHCIPVYPRLYLSSDSRPGVVKAARDLNASMPMRMIERLEQALGELSGSTVLVLGVAYRPGVKEDAFSGAHSLNKLLGERGATPRFIDPYYSSEELGKLGFESWSEGQPASAIIAHTEHPDFLGLSSNQFPGLKIVLDGRNFLSPASWPGVTFYCLGK